MAAITSPLLDTSIDGAGGVLINITGGADLTLMEVHEAAQQIRELVDDDANIIFGAIIVPNAKPEVKITLIATGVQLGTGSGRRAPMSSPMPQPPSLDPNRGYDRPSDLDLPAFLRRRR